jgi:membrane-bound lytic murein transglycosylase B
VTGTTLVTPIKFEGKQGDEYWLGLHNFYVITRYNHSAMYAMAVHQLSGALRARML